MTDLVHRPVTVGNQVFWRLQTRTHQESGPINGVKLDDVFPNNLQADHRVTDTITSDTYSSSHEHRQAMLNNHPFRSQPPSNSWPTHPAKHKCCARDRLQP
jgi:hypothetical protein